MISAGAAADGLWGNLGTVAGHLLTALVLITFVAIFFVLGHTIKKIMAPIRNAVLALIGRWLSTIRPGK